MIRGVTIHQPLASALVHGPRDACILNVSWQPVTAPGDWLAVYAARTNVPILPQLLQEIRELWPAMPDPVALPREVFLAAVEVAGTGGPEHVGTNGWARGPYCVLLRRIVPIQPPLPYPASRTRQGLWRIPPAVVEALRERVRRHGANPRSPRHGHRPFGRYANADPPHPRAKRQPARRPSEPGRPY